MARVFVERAPELLAIEGWYEVDGIRVKISCRFNDFLRASRTKHFSSCFAEGGSRSHQRHRRLYDKRWAVIYTPDKRGDFLGRAWCYLDDEGTLVVEKIYGNKLNKNLIEDIMTKIDVKCRFSHSDTYLPELN